jgi:DNA repair protein RecN (Recombination protein N)
VDGGAPAAAAKRRCARLDRGRIEELARMLGGAQITETTRRHAAEMLGAG